MSLNQIRNLLGIFFLGTTTVLGAYIILFQETPALPISRKDASSAFQIIIPTLVAQLTIIFQWIANPPADQDINIVIPRWAIIGPPVAVISILVVTFILLIIDGGRSLDGGSIFKNSVTFCVSLLGASTVIIVGRVFSDAGKQKAATTATGQPLPNDPPK